MLATEKTHSWSFFAAYHEYLVISAVSKLNKNDETEFRWFVSGKPFDPLKYSINKKLVCRNRKNPTKEHKSLEAIRI